MDWALQCTAGQRRGQSCGNGTKPKRGSPGPHLDNSLLITLHLPPTRRAPRGPPLSSPLLTSSDRPPPRPAKPPRPLTHTTYPPSLHPPQPSQSPRALYLPGSLTASQSLPAHPPMRGDRLPIRNAAVAGPLSPPGPFSDLKPAQCRQFDKVFNFFVSHYRPISRDLSNILLTLSSLS
uniref:Uncharacterized protein n=1 Tax=Knipowitschia caucasica TaxID=637954 RepID=A0AAV2LGI8_KNICA